MSQNSPEPVTIRPACRGEEGLILQLIRELADYEKLLHEVTATEEDIRASLFSGRATAEPLLVHVGEKPAGFAIFFHNYSTFLGKNGLYLEDVYVRPEYRHGGIGKAILQHLAGIAMERGCGRFEWAVLNWNEPAIRFYRSLNACPQNDWTVYRLDREGIEHLAANIRT
jgi:GNAT superfamily N-acetyltransferase